MSRTLTSRIARTSTGITAFVAAGMLVFAILSGHGGHGESQNEWRDAKDRAVQINRDADLESSYLDSLIKENTPLYIDQTTTGSVATDTGSEESKLVADEPDPNEELSVLSLIRNNSDIKPGVSSGTARVSIVIKSGDTLFNISKKHGISLDDLAELNGLAEPYTIKIGQTLYVAR